MIRTILPEIVDPGDPTPHTLDILIVADGLLNFGGFGDNFFSLAILVDVLTNSTVLPVPVNVTKASRGRPPEPGVIPDFVFTESELRKYQEVWLFGMANIGELSLEPDELKALSDFMDRGNGVFATGDHDDLGASLCSQVPRVRSMRNWSTPVRPTFETSSRFDTLRSGQDTLFQFADEVDSVPQELFPIMKSEPPNMIGCPKAFPHRVLCGPKGVIKFLPDHRHEGECLEPRNLSDTFNFGDDVRPEYPTTSDGHQEAPSLIARARVFEPHTTDNKDICFPVTQVDSFGAISTYDGHEVGVGRVVADSTFHHFVFLNVDPFRRAAATGGVIEKLVYEQIVTYFKNIAIWLAPEAMQDDICYRALLAACWTYPLNETLFSVDKGIIENKDWRSVLHLGTVARDTLAQLGLDCETLQWVSRLVQLANDPISLSDPWTQRPQPSPDFTALLGTDMLVSAALGGAVLQISSRFPIEKFFNRNAQGKVEMEKAVLKKTVAEGVAHGMTAFQLHVEQFTGAMADALKMLPKR